MPPFHKFRLILSFAFIQFHLVSTAQYYNIGQDPASLQWRHIKTSNFNLIYPADFEQNAQRLINILEYVHTYGSYSMAYKPARIPVIIHNRIIEPNALTIWAPKRIEFFTCPPQNTYAQDWLEQLAIHEYRHAVQMDRTNQGFSKVMSWIFGQQAPGAISGILIPSWFLEGDAVCTETALSHSGRGRVPEFEMELRAQVLQKGIYSYDKAVSGSYKSFIPDQYAIGYQMVANIRRKYDAQAWVKALDEIAKRPFTLVPFNRGLKKATGHTKEENYKITLDELGEMWKEQDKLTPKTSFTLLTKIPEKQYEKYKYPHYLNDTLIVAEWTSRDDIQRFVLVGPNGFKQKVVTPGFFSSESFSVYTGAGFQADFNKPGSFAADNILVNNGLLAWTEKQADIRWENRSYSVLKIYNFSTGVIRTITSKSRYFAHDLSPDGKKLVVVKIDEVNKSSLVVLDVVNGKELLTLQESSNNVFLNPSWSKDASKIVYAELSQNGKCINIFHMDTKVVNTILPSTFSELSNPVFASDYVLFNGSYSGIGNIFAINLADNSVYQVTSSDFGAYNASLSPDGKKIVYSDYSSDGFNLVQAEFEPSKWKPVSEIVDHSPSLYKYLLKDEKGIVDSTLNKDSVFVSKKYNKSTHLFNFHSWAPAYVNYMAGDYGSGVSFMSQNELSTATSVVGYKYDMAEKTGQATFDFTYAGWFPVLDISANYGSRTAFTDSVNPVKYSFNEIDLSGGFTLPLHFTNGKFYSGLEISAHTQWYNITDNTSPETDKLEGIIQSFNYKLLYYRYIKQAIKDVYPDWGQVLTAQFKHSPGGSNSLVTISALALRLYFPGFAPNHGIRIDAAYQKRETGDYRYANLINLPRGYLASSENEISSFGFNYKFPFLYPDFPIWHFVYFKRFKANMFYDIGRSIHEQTITNMQSMGVELTSDVNFFMFLFPFYIGARIGYVPNEKRFFSDLLFSLNLVF